MNTFDTIAARRSYRGKYLPTPIPREHLYKIMVAGCHAPSGCNKQTTSFIAVDDPEILARFRTVIRPPQSGYLPCHDLCVDPEDRSLPGPCFQCAGLLRRH